MTKQNMSIVDSIVVHCCSPVVVFCVVVVLSFLLLLLEEELVFVVVAVLLLLLLSYGKNTACRIFFPHWGSVLWHPIFLSCCSSIHFNFSEMGGNEVDERFVLFLLLLYYF